MPQVIVKLWPTDSILKKTTTSSGGTVERIDGGYCASNPTLYAIAGATKGFKSAPARRRLVNVGVGEQAPQSTP